MTDTYKALEENKIEKALRNTKEFNKALVRATKGQFDEELTDARGLNLLKVTERFNLREIFDIEAGTTYFKLYKEVYYVENPGKYYFDTVEPTVYRRIAGQHEKGDLRWAKAIAKEYGIDITFREEKKAGRPAKTTKATDAVKD